MSNKGTAVGRNIRKYRLERGITLDTLARQIDVTLQQLLNYESGRTRITEQTIIKVSQALDVPVQDLFAEVAS
jgi:XRE family transcriptional regulator, regulator of sulfur utilization